MAKKPARKALGRGLSALLGDAETSGAVATGAPEPSATSSAAARPGPSMIPIDLIRANPSQPRQSFHEQDLDELARSLKTHGVVQPVLLRPDPKKKGSYQVVAGERRWRAAQRAGLHELPAVIRELDDRQTLELAIIENVQRVDLDPIEEALGYSQLIETFKYTQEELATEIGKSRSHLANTMRLLALPDPVQNMLRNGKLSAGHARALITSPDPEKLASEVVAKGLSVRQTEALAKQLPENLRGTPRKPAPAKDSDTRMLEGDLSAAIGMKVTITHDPKQGGGQMTIRYKSLDALDELCRKLAE